MKRHRRLTQPFDRPFDNLVRAHHLRSAGRRLDQLLVGGEERLQRVVVDQLRDPPPPVILRLHDLRDQPARLVQLGFELRNARSKLRDLRINADRMLRFASASAGSVRDHYSRSPRRIASATAAARSDTPSFS